ncbi:MAG: hypothetical protein CMH83_14075 [Nocardioides sp.]|nr:hypothetical protein [Nocardioides sp.]
MTGEHGPATELWAHGLGGQRDLPIPLDLAVSGAVAALVVSFTVLAVAWRRPRYDAATSGRPAPAWLDALVSSTALLVVARVFGLFLAGFTAFAAVFGQDTYINPFFGIVAVWLWVGIVPASLLLGRFWRAISPFRTVLWLFSKAAGTDPDEGLARYPERLGLWPAAFGLYAFVWLELVNNFSSLGGVRLWFALYCAAMVLGSAVYGGRFLERADPFEVYSTLVAHLSPWGRRDGHVVLRSPLANLDTLPALPGLVVVVGVLFGSTGFDSFRESPTFVTFVQGSSIDGQMLLNLGLLTFCVGATVVFAVGTMLTGLGDDEHRVRRTALPDLYAHSVVPIIVGYVAAHYLTYLFEIGSRTLQQAGDPLSNGSNLLGLADITEISWFSYHPTLLATLKVLFVVVGHVVGAVAAHDRALKLLPAKHHLTGQLPLLVAMVFFTSGGLYLLFSA